jgi:valyl-tRNA synthetase
MLFLILQALVKLLHPVIPFVTEEIWQHLRKVKVDPDPELPESIVLAKWHEVSGEAINPTVEAQFAVFQELLRAVRDVRASRNVPPKMEIAFSVRCDEATATLLKPMEPYFLSMARAKATAWGPATQSPALSTTVPLAGMDVFVDISDLIDIPAELAKKEKELEKLEGFIKAKESKLSGDFIQKAPAAVVEKERQSLEELKEQLRTTLSAIEQLRQNDV